MLENADSAEWKVELSQCDEVFIGKQSDFHPGQPAICWPTLPIDVSENSCFWILVPVWMKKRMIQKRGTFGGSQVSYLYKPSHVVTWQLSNRLLLFVLERQKRRSGSEITWFCPFLTENCYCHVLFMAHSHVILDMNPLYEWLSEKPLEYVKTCLIFCILCSRHKHLLNILGFWFLVVTKCKAFFLYDFGLSIRTFMNLELGFHLQWQSCSNKLIFWQNREYIKDLI